MTIKQTGQPLGYSVVALPQSNRQLFTSERGTFTLWNLRAGPLRIRFKHIGYSPRDTVVILRDTDTIRVDIALSLLTMQLPTVHVSGACGSRVPDESTAGVLAELFDQVQQNADRYRLLADSNPFQLLMYRVHGTRIGTGKILPLRIDTVVRAAFPDSPYEPRHLVHITPATDSTAGYADLAVPEIADFADTAFTHNHCFTYAGQRMVDGDSVIAVDFEPIPALKNEIDFRGTMFVRATGYQLVRADLVLTNLPPSLRARGMLNMTVTAVFTEVLPGIPMVNSLQSNARIRNGFPSRAEFAQVIDIKWLKGPP